MPNRTVKILLFAPSSFLMMASPSFAACHIGESAFVFQNENVSATQDADSQGCGIKFRADPKARATFDNASIVSLLTAVRLKSAEAGSAAENMAPVVIRDVQQLNIMPTYLVLLPLTFTKARQISKMRIENDV